MLLGVLWLTTEVSTGPRTIRNAQTERGGRAAAIDTASAFFLGILLAVGALQEAGHLIATADWLRIPSETST